MWKGMWKRSESNTTERGHPRPWGYRFISRMLPTMPLDQSALMKASRRTPLIVTQAL
jgi:hypothetical protein